VVFFLRFIELLCQVLTMVILIRAITSWVTTEQSNIFTRTLYNITEPILAPLRRIVPRFGVVDFTPLVAVIVLQIIAAVASLIVINIQNV
jgi:YggT family protein